MQGQQALQGGHDFVADGVPLVLFLLGAEALSLGIFLDPPQQVVEAGGQEAQFVAAAQVGEVVAFQAAVGVDGLGEAAGAPGEGGDAADDADLDDQPGQADGPQHGADEPGKTGGDGGKGLVYAAGVALEEQAVVAKRRRHFVRQLDDRGIEGFHRQHADEAGEQG